VGIPADARPIRTYILYLQVSLVSMFALCYALAIVTRRDMAVHARFMICTGFTLIDPVVIRLMFWIHDNPTWNYQWFTFGLTDGGILALFCFGGDQRRGRWVFPTMLLVFVVSQLPALFHWTAAPQWQAFARWFAALPLT